MQRCVLPANRGWRPCQRFSSSLTSNNACRRLQVQAPAAARMVRAQGQQQQAEQATASESEDKVPPGCSRYSVTLGKPMGLILEEDGAGGIFVAEIMSDSNAARSGEIGVGDQLIATSGLTYTSSQEYNEIVVRGGEKLVRLNVRGNSFKTVMAAISSHPAHIKVTLDLQRCQK